MEQAIVKRKFTRDYRNKSLTVTELEAGMIWTPGPAQGFGGVARSHTSRATLFGCDSINSKFSLLLLLSV